MSHFITTNKKTTEELVFDCDKCGKRHSYEKDDLSLDFECVGGEERSMGPENEYQATEYFDCDCGKEINVTFHVWEYPVGIHNYDDVAIDGAKLISSPYVTVDFSDGDEFEPDVCDKCGKNFIDKMNTGICDECESEYQK